jgi:hypothetical protein
LSVAVSDEKYIGRVKLALEHLHNCGAIHCATVPVHEVFRGQTVWKGDVEVFDIKGNPKANHAYAWSEKPPNGERFFAVLEVPPIKSALDAVRASIVADKKKQDKEKGRNER